MANRDAILEKKHWVAVAGLLLLYVLMAVSANLQKCTTTDETLHLLSGYLYWTEPARPIYPENGIAAQTWAALPLLFDHLRTPPAVDESQGVWGHIGEFYRFFYSMGNDTALMLLQGRAMISLLGVALGALIFIWSRQLFGSGGAYISLLLFIFCPNMLANGALVTTDMAATLGFFVATYSFWNLTHTVSLRNLIFSVLALNYLVLAKMSSGLIIPIFLLILITRIFSKQPIEIRFRTHKTTDLFFAKLGVWSGLLLVHLIVVVGMLWLVYNFQYCSRGQQEARMQVLCAPDFSIWSSTGLKASVIETISECGILPPAYVEGLSFILQANDERPAYLCGMYSTKEGWWWYFPLAFLLKTPIASLILLFSSLFALVIWRGFPRLWRIEESQESKVQPCPTLYDLAPLLILGGAYGLACLTSHVDEGSRYLLPVYPVLFVLAGANAFWLMRGKPLFKIALAALLMGTMVESLSVWPNYLAFFNQLVGGPRNGYRYFSDCSLDWGQNLPSLHKWLEKNVPSKSGTPVYLSYDGEGDPQFYGIHVLRLPGWPDVNYPQTFPLQGGTYCMSVGIVFWFSHFYMPWKSDYDPLYSQLQAETSQWDSTANDPTARNRLLQERGADHWAHVFRNYGILRLSRLCIYLQHRAPDEEVDYSIFIYRLSDDEVRRALSAATL